jgi:hypothetical protein
MNGGLHALAARSIIRHGWGSRISPDILDTLLVKLAASAQHDAAGELLEHLQRFEDALQSFRACAALLTATCQQHVHMLRQMRIALCCMFIILHDMCSLKSNDCFQALLHKSVLLLHPSVGRIA